MPHKGQIIRNPRTGEFVEFMETAAETGGAYTRIKIKVMAGGFKPVLHMHTTTDETFEIISGRLAYVLDGEKNEIGPCEKITLPKGKTHTHYNNEVGPLLMYQTFTPSLDIDLFLENIFGLDAEGKVPKGQPAFLQLMVWGKKFQCKAYIASVPLGIQKALSFILAPVGRLLGYKAIYKRFSGFDA
jgi:mannose-6-phosphate isomerase-like protein (cupin superfamily)